MTQGLIKNFNIGEHAELTAQFLPSGDALVNKNYEGSNLRKFVEAYSEEFKRLNDLMSTFNKEYDPSTTTLFLSNWESAINIPDNCFKLADTVTERQQNILVKLQTFGLQTEQDFIDLGATFGIVVTVAGADYPPHEVPHFIIVGGQGFTWTLSGDFASFPEQAETYQCLVKLLIPACYEVIFVQIP